LDLELSPERLRKLADVLELVYAAKINLLDSYFGMLLDAVAEHGLSDQSLIAFTADHGEIFYRENALFQWTHGGELAPEVLSVPWIVRMAGLSPGSYDPVTRSIDVFPTLAGLAGISLPTSESVEGVDLSAPLLGKQPPPHLIAFSHTTTIEGNQVETHRNNLLGTVYFPRPDPELIWVRAREGDLVYKHRNLDGTSWGHEVFDLAADPGETKNLFDPANPDHQRMVEALARYKAELVEGYGRSSAQELHDEDSLERLKELGYAAEE
jgi:arylsulfatase A-like enzyme